MKTGMVFDIQKYSTQDGTGIRTNVFMKGCPLKCKWCSNPESQRREPCLMLSDRNCYGCGRCTKVCPTGASSITEQGLFWDSSKCTECMACVKGCYAKARSICGQEYTVEQITDIIEQDMTFYGRSGGMTVGGGEPLLQADFVAELLKSCKEDYYLNTAIETCLHVPWENVEKVVPYLNILYMDIKHMDTEKHKEATGVGNERILDNIKRISEAIDPTWQSAIIRVPVIPGINDSEENIRETAEYVASLKTFKRIELLPYHNLGMNKYRRTKRETPYELTDVQPPSNEQMIRLKEICEAAGNVCQIGGVS